MGRFSTADAIRKKVTNPINISHSSLETVIQTSCIGQSWGCKSALGSGYLPSPPTLEKPHTRAHFPAIKRGMKRNILDLGMTFFGCEGSLGWTIVGSIHWRIGQGVVRGLRWNPTEQLRSAPHPASVNMFTAVTLQPQLQAPWLNAGVSTWKPCPSSLSHCYPHSLACEALSSLISIWTAPFCTASNLYFCINLRGKSTPCWLSHLTVTLVTEGGRIRMKDSRTIPQSINANLGKVSCKKCYMELNQGWAGKTYIHFLLCWKEQSSKSHF